MNGEEPQEGNACRFPKCMECHRDLEDWEGNVMVRSSDFGDRQIPEIRIICKQCTNALDSAGSGREWHNLWELRWVKTNPVWCLARALAGFIYDTHPRWKQAAVEDLCSLVGLAHPGMSASPIGIEW